MPPALFIVGVLASIVWIVVRLVVHNEDVAGRALLAREYAKSINGLYLELWKALEAAEPITEITAIQTSVMQRVGDAVKNKVWPYNPPPPPLANIAYDLTEEINRIRITFMPKWKPPSPGAT